MKGLKQRMPKLAVAVVSVLLVVVLVAIPIMANIPIKVPTPSGPAYSTSYADGVYTVDINSAYVGRLIEDNNFNKETLKEQLPESIYNLLVNRDVDAIRGILEDLLRQVANEYLGINQGGESAVETETADTATLRTAPKLMMLAAEAETGSGGGWNLDSIPDGFELTQENINHVLGVVNNMLDQGLLTMDQIKDMVDTEKLGELIGVPDVKVEDVLDGTHNDAIINSGVTTEQIKETVDPDKFASLEISNRDLARVVINYLLDKLPDLAARIYQIKLTVNNGEPVAIFDPNTTQLNVALAEQTLLAAVPTLDEVVTALGADGDSAPFISLGIQIGEERVVGEPLVWHNYAVCVNFDGSVEDRAVLKDYAEHLAEYGSYTLDGETVALDVRLSRGFFEVNLQAIDKTMVDQAWLVDTLGADVAALDFADDANLPLILDRIIQTCTINDLVELLRCVNDDNLDADRLSDFQLTADRVTTARKYLIRALDNANSLATLATEYGSIQTATDFMDTLTLGTLYDANGRLAYAYEFSMDALETIEKVAAKADEKAPGKIPGMLMDLPETVTKYFMNTTLTHTVSLSLEIEDLYRASYLVDADTVEHTMYTFAGSSLTYTSDTAPRGWATTADAAIGTTTAVMPAGDISLAPLRQATFNAYIDSALTQLHTSQTAYFTFLSDKSQVLPAVPAAPGYTAWTWADYSLTGGDITVNGYAAAPAVYDHPLPSMTDPFGSDKVYHFEVKDGYSYGDSVWNILLATEGYIDYTSDNPGYTHKWYYVPKVTAPAPQGRIGRMARAASEVPDHAVWITDSTTVPAGGIERFGVQSTVDEYSVTFTDADGTVLGTGAYTVENGHNDMREFQNDVLMNYLTTLAGTVAEAPTGYRIALVEIQGASLTATALRDIEVKVTYELISFETDPETDPETNPETEPETQPETNPETEPETQPETYPDTTPDTVPDTVPDTTPDTQPETQPDTAPGTVVPGGETSPDTDALTMPGTGSETEPGDKDKGLAWWWILIIILLVIVIAACVIILLLRRRGETVDDSTPPVPPVTEEPAPEPEPAPAAPLFVPLGEEIPEEEIPEEIEIVEEVTADTVDDLMTDIVAEHFLENTAEAGGLGKLGIINVGVLSANYNDGDTITLEDLQAKGLIEDNIGRLKVLAAGTLNKHLIVKADAFSVQAIKMITLTGGHAVKLSGCDQ